MKKTTFQRSLLHVVLSLILIAAMVFSFAACSPQAQADPGAQVTTGDAAPIEVGEGGLSFTFEVVGEDEAKTVYAVKTEEKTVGAALLALDLIAGDESEYGLYVKTVDGQTVDYDTDGKYWAFYVDGEYATAGVDATEITQGSTYTFQIEQ